MSAYLYPAVPILRALIADAASGASMEKFITYLSKLFRCLVT
jgi:hypothetical protein